jgi:ribose-phosphate pyrophosphokinase
MKPMKKEAAVLCYGDRGFMQSVGEEINERFGYDATVPIEVNTFASKELYPIIKSSIRRKRVYVIANLEGYCGEIDPNVGLMRVFLINDAVRRASASEINDVLTFLPYGRQERKDKPRSAISAKVVADMLVTTGANRISTIDMHADAAQGFCNIPVDHLTAIPTLAGYLVNNGYDINDKDWVLVAPDEGALTRTMNMKKHMTENYDMDIKVAVTMKNRNAGTGDVDVMFVVGDVDGKNALYVDDMLDSGSTICEGAKALRRKGAGEVRACCTHGIFSRKKGVRAEDRLREAGIRVLTTDSIPRTDSYIEQNKDWLDVASIASLIGEAVFRIDTDGSVSELYNTPIKF